jgi:endonuclease YncB( thermonuclease family)
MQMKRRGLAVACAVIASQALLLAQGWEKLDRCKFHEGSHSDGDSVEVFRDGKRYVFRLYFVDCIEKNPVSRARRAVQARYFAIAGSPENVGLRAAYLASALTRNELSRPFTVYTRWQRVDPDNGNPAVRAFIQTANGDDLSTLLVSQGLAIIREGKRAVSDHPDGRSINEFSSQLRRAEREARAMKRGAWGLSKAEAAGALEGIIEASDREALVANAGRNLRVRGRVSRIGVLPGRMTFLNFNESRDGFVGIIRNKFQARFSEHFPSGLRSSLVGKEVVLEGIITLYHGVPQIELESPSQVHIEP